MREFANIDMFERLGGDNPSPKEKAFREFLQEMEETACGGPRTEAQFVRMIKHLPKIISPRDVEVLLKPKDVGAQ